jgi:hypothetical protein
MYKYKLQRNLITLYFCTKTRLLKLDEVGSVQNFIRCAVRISAGILCNLIEADREKAIQQATVAPLHTLSNTLITIIQSFNHFY